MGERCFFRAPFSLLHPCITDLCPLVKLKFFFFPIFSLAYAYFLLVLPSHWAFWKCRVWWVSSLLPAHQQACFPFCEFLLLPWWRESSVSGSHCYWIMVVLSGEREHWPLLGLHVSPHGQGLSTSHQQSTGTVPVGWNEKKNKIYFSFWRWLTQEECPTESEVPNYSEDN